jgi:hypothetical protein
LQTEQQLNLFKQFGHRGICVDGTHNVTRYGLKLITMLVYTESQRGHAIAYFICKEESEECMDALFHCMRDRLFSAINSISKLSDGETDESRF